MFIRIITQDSLQPDQILIYLAAEDPKSTHVKLQCKKGEHLMIGEVKYISSQGLGIDPSKVCTELQVKVSKSTNVSWLLVSVSRFAYI